VFCMVVRLGDSGATPHSVPCASCLDSYDTRAWRAPAPWGTTRDALDNVVSTPHTAFWTILSSSAATCQPSRPRDE
jgi:hypothetical protein